MKNCLTNTLCQLYSSADVVNVLFYLWDKYLQMSLMSPHILRATGTKPFQRTTKFTEFTANECKKTLPYSHRRATWVFLWPTVFSTIQGSAKTAVHQDMSISYKINAPNYPARISICNQYNNAEFNAVQ